jgi:hypothetical protein
MTVRSSMSALIKSVRVLINDTLPVGNGQIFDDQTIQDVLDEGRLDITNHPLESRPTFSGSTVQYLDYYSDLGGGFEDGMVLKQYLTVSVTPSLIEPIPGHFQFASNVFPPVFITGKNYDVYRASADLLERLAAQWILSYSIVVDGQSLQRNQATRSILLLVKEYRRKQRPRTITIKRGDVSGSQGDNADPTAPTNLDYYSSGSPQG